MDDRLWRKGLISPPKHSLKTKVGETVLADTIPGYNPFCISTSTTSYTCKVHEKGSGLGVRPGSTVYLQSSSVIPDTQRAICHIPFSTALLFMLAISSPLLSR